MDDPDPDAFRALYRAHYRTVCRYVAARADADVVEDVAAETFLVAWRRRRELPEQLVPWLLNTASKCLANHRRSRDRATALAQRLAHAPSGESTLVDDALTGDAQRRALIAALAAASDRDRELLLLRHWDGLAPREIARVLETPPVVVRTRLHRAERRLQSALADALRREDVPYAPTPTPQRTLT